MMAIFYFSSQTDPLPAITEQVWDKALHAATYALLAALLCRALFGEGLRSATTLVMAALIASAYGAADEYHQSFVTGRDADVADWMVDALGALIGAIGHVVGSLRN
jgi:VanZ family protein